MHEKFWLNRWDEGCTGWHQPAINAQLQQWLQSGTLRPVSTVFVPLCGASLDLKAIRDAGHQVVGIDLSGIAMGQFFDLVDLDPVKSAAGGLTRWQAGGYTLYEGDLFALDSSIAGSIDYIYDRASLIALPLETRRKYIPHVYSQLAPQADGLLLTIEYPQEEMDGPPFSVSTGEVRGSFSGMFSVNCVSDVDALDASIKLKERGVSTLQERAYELSRR